MQAIQGLASVALSIDNVDLFRPFSVMKFLNIACNEQNEVTMRDVRIGLMHYSYVYIQHYLGQFA